MYRWVARPIALWLLLPVLAYAQRGSLTGVVVTRDTKERLPYSVVAIPALGREQFTTDSGTFTIGDLPVGSMVLTVRRLGFVPSDVTINVTGPATTVAIELDRIVVRLGTVTVRARPPCTTPGPPKDTSNATLLTLFTQLQMNGEQFRTLTAQYPFISAMDARRIHKYPRKDPREVARSVISVDSKRDQWEYRPGKVVSRQFHDYIFNIPTLFQFADPGFLAEHCFHYAGVDTVRDLPMLRIDLVAADRIRDPDVYGSLYLDPDTYQIRRSVLHLTRMPPIRAMSDFVVTTDFDEVMESIPVISHVFSEQSYDTTRTRDYDAVYEDWRLLGVKWKGRKPGQNASPKP